MGWAVKPLTTQIPGTPAGPWPLFFPPTPYRGPPTTGNPALPIPYIAPLYHLGPGPTLSAGQVPDNVGYPHAIE